MTSVTMLTDDNIVHWKTLIENIILFLSLYKDILDAYVLDFYSKSLWGNLNCKWALALANFNSSDLSNFLRKGSSLKKKEVLPLSLLSFRATCFSFMLPRHPPKSAELLNDSIMNLCDRGKKLCSFGSKLQDECIVNRLNLEKSWKNSSEELSPQGGQHYILGHIFRKHLKPKKQHEVVRMAQLSSSLYHCSNSKRVVDIGSGQGHLARLIGYGFGIPTICLDAEEDFINGARKFDKELESRLKQKMGAEGVTTAPQHSICQLGPNVVQNDFTEALRKTSFLTVSSESSQIDEKHNEPFSLVGLHSCGDLGPTMMRLFDSITSCRSLLLVGCCYMKLTTNSSSREEESSRKGYPMSCYVRGLACNHLSYVAREMACHAIENYSDKLKLGVEDLKVHCYRAVLEELIVRQQPELEHSGLRSVKNAHKMPFAIYAQKAVVRLESFSLANVELETYDIRSKLENWMRVVIFYSLRLMMAPAVETLILLDRLVYFHEKRRKCFLAPVFDPILSPRNYAVIVVKED